MGENMNWKWVQCQRSKVRRTLITRIKFYDSSRSRWQRQRRRRRRIALHTFTQYLRSISARVSVLSNLNWNIEQSRRQHTAWTGRKLRKRYERSICRLLLWMVYDVVGRRKRSSSLIHSLDIDRENIARAINNNRTLERDINGST